MKSYLKFPNLRDITIQFGERVLLQLGCMDIDYPIRKDEPSTILATSTKVAIELYENWEKCNRLSIMFIKTHIYASIHGFIETRDKV